MMSKSPGCKELPPLAKARKHWRIALDMARRLRISDMEKKASERLGHHWPDRDIP
jgi:hypothetical protein